MKPEKALSLVLRYGQLNRLIKELTKRIGESLNECEGVNGDRIVFIDVPVFDGFRITGTEKVRDINGDLDEKQRDRKTHLYQWYKPDYTDDGYFYGAPLIYMDIGDEQKDECPHCYAAHMAIQERKAARKELGSVKRAMSLATDE